MAGDFLSQDEVDALLKGVTGDADETEVEEQAAGGARPYNLGTQERIVRGRMPTLELIDQLGDQNNGAEGEAHLVGRQGDGQRLFVVGQE